MPAKPKKVIHLAEVRGEKIKRAGSMPDPLPIEQIAQLLRLAAKNHYTYEQIMYATRTVALWHAGDPARRMRTDWVAVIMNAARMGWGLRGFAQWRERTGNTRDTTLTPHKQAKIIERIRERRKREEEDE